jgi:NADH-quinone oxidoreductase subunit J
VLAPALFVVLDRNLVHGVLWLGLTLLVTAGLYVQLDAPFVAAVQLLLYAGGVVILLVFGVMLTRHGDGVEVPSQFGSPLRGLLVAVPLFGVMAWAILKTPQLDAAAPPLPVATVGRSLMTDFVLAFEVLSVLLLAGMIGAIVIARRRDPGEEGA